MSGNPTWTCGRLVITLAPTIDEAPLLDSILVTHAEGWRAHGWLIKLRPIAGRGVAVAWRWEFGPRWTMPPWQLRTWGPFAMRHRRGLDHWSPRQIHWGRRRATGHDFSDRCDAVGIEEVRDAQ